VKKAECTIDAKEYTADEFSNLPKSEITTKKFHLLCKSCKQKAFFRKKHMRIGKSIDATFGSLHHLESCDYYLQTTEGIGWKNKDEDSPATVFKIIGISVSESSKRKKSDTPTGSRGASSGQGSSGGGDGSQTINLGLKKLLKLLIKDQKFRESECIIEFGDEAKTVAEFCISLNDKPVDPYESEEVSGKDWAIKTNLISGIRSVEYKKCFYWGKIDNVRSLDSVHFLNMSSYNSAIDVMLSNDLYEIANNMFEFEKDVYLIVYHQRTRADRIDCNEDELPPIAVVRV
jgi:hypothetical protein